MVRHLAGGRDAGGRPYIGLRQVEREAAARAGRTPELDFAAEKACELTADGETESGAAVLAAGARIRLLEGLKDDSLLFGRDAKAGVGDFKGNDSRGAREDGMVRRPAAGDRRNGEPDAAVLGELEGIGEQVLEYLLQALGIGDEAACEVRVGIDLESQLAILCFVAEGPAHHVDEAAEEDLFRFDRYRA